VAERGWEGVEQPVRLWSAADRLCRLVEGPSVGAAAGDIAGGIRRRGDPPPTRLRPQLPHLAGTQPRPALRRDPRARGPDGADLPRHRRPGGRARHRGHDEDPERGCPATKRPPRAAAYSWRNTKQYVDATSAARSTAYWDLFNLGSEAITRRYPERSLFLRYEDFIAGPAVAIDALLELCGGDRDANPVRGRVVELHVNHTVTGNPDRFNIGPTTIRETDDGWRAGLPASAKLAAMTISGPLLGRYGYRYRGTFSNEACPDRPWLG
jgi:hypothetical protein